jgi:hypothetical protein
MNPHLIFIYKTESGFFEDLKGAAKKAVGGKSVCALCNITHGVLSEKETWRAFVDKQDPEPVFYHADDIPDRVESFLDENNISLPVILRQDGAEFSVAADAQELTSCEGDPKCLIDILES